MSKRDELAQTWNAAGRAYFTKYSDSLRRLYAGEELEIDAEDPRTEADGDAVMAEALAIAAEGRPIREVFDPAHAPLMGWIKSNEAPLSFVAIMGPDELLVHQGAAWHDAVATYHLHGTTATRLADIRGFYRTRNREHLVVARGDGLHFYNARDGVAALSRPALAMLPWPPLSIFAPAGMSKEQAAEFAESFTDTRIDVESLQMSDDGTRVVMTAYRQGILLASRRPGEPPWQLLWPSVTPPFGDPASEYVRAGDMTHAAISRDGTRLAFGSQDTAHYTATVDDGGQVHWYATIGNLSEYPHHAAFSDSGKAVLFNSCHFYNGASVTFAWTGNAGVDLEPYEVHPQAPCIDNSLRVYASSFLPTDVSSAIIGAAAQGGTFALAGAGIMRFYVGGVGLRGAQGAQGFGSSASAMDYDPELQRMALSTYAGYVHVYDPLTEEDPGRIDGWRARKEVARWALWPRLPSGPIRW